VYETERPLAALTGDMNETTERFLLCSGFADDVGPGDIVGCPFPIPDPVVLARGAIDTTMQSLHQVHIEGTLTEQIRGASGKSLIAGVTASHPARRSPPGSGFGGRRPPASTLGYRPPTNLASPVRHGAHDPARDG
jgi:hypothetical protein